MLSLLAPVILAGAQGEGDGDAPQASFPEDFQVVLGLMESAGLDEALVGMDGKFTLFAPHDDAFSALPEGILDHLRKPANADILRSVLRYHLVPRRFVVEDAKEIASLTTVEGSELPVKYEGEVLKVGKAEVIATGFEHAGGVVHGLDTVLVPDPVAKSMQASVFGCATACELLRTSGLQKTLAAMDGYTLFVPTDRAFAALDAKTREALLDPENRDKLQRVLRHHAMASLLDSETARDLAEGSGDEKGARVVLLDGWAWLRAVDAGLVLGGANLVRVDERPAGDGWGNCTVHVIDKVLLPDDLELVTTDEKPESP